MGNPDNYEVKYWAGDNDFNNQIPQSPKRSVKRKLFIVFSFIAVLAITPTLIFGLSNLNFKPAPKVSVVQNSPEAESITEPEVIPVTITEPTNTQTAASSDTNITETEVLNNDSYWKITKRVCGTGKYYLSVQSQNDNKPLKKGDNVTVSCVL